MKKLLGLFLFMFLLGGPVFGADSPIQLPDGVTIKQGVLLKWDDPRAGVLNLSTFSIAETVASDSFNKYVNAVWDGWSLDVGGAYDSNNFGVVGLMVGRDFGTLGKYLPIYFPLKDKIDITIYPVGILADDQNGEIHFKGASGLGILKATLTF